VVIGGWYNENEAQLRLLMLIINTALQYFSASANPLKNKTVGFGQRPRPLHNFYTRPLGMAIMYHSRYKFLTFSLPKRLRNGRFASESAVRPCAGFRSETATWTQKWFKMSPAEASRKL
jgi:hypothetical protein